MAKGAASSLTDASPEARRARMARRVASASARKIWSRRLAAFFLIAERFNNLMVMHQAIERKAKNRRGWEPRAARGTTPRLLLHLG